jgi:hypothetical protein
VLVAQQRYRRRGVVMTDQEDVGLGDRLLAEARLASHWLRVSRVFLDAACSTATRRQLLYNKYY